MRTRISTREPVSQMVPVRRTTRERYQGGVRRSRASGSACLANRRSAGTGKRVRLRKSSGMGVGASEPDA